MNKCWYCDKELKNENDKEHLGICDKCYQESFKVGNTVLTKLIKYKTDKDQKITDLEAKLAESEEYNKMLLEEKSGYIDLVSGYSKKCKNYEQQLAEKEHSIEMLNQHLTDKAIEIERLGEELAENKKESDDYVMSAIERYADLKNRLTQAQKERELDNAFWKQECDSLQKSLAEKDKIIENLKIDLKDWQELEEKLGTKYDKVVEQLAEKEKEIREIHKQLFYCESLLVRECKECDNKFKTDFAIEQLEKVKELLLENLYDLYSKPSEIWDKYGDLYDVVVEGAVNGTIDNQIKRLKENNNE